MDMNNQSADRFSRFETLLRGYERKNRIRRLHDRSGHDFSSNDYLGLAASPRLAQAIQEALARGVAVGAAGSRLLRGHHPEHEQLEIEAAALFGVDRCLFYGGGFAANVALLSVLPARGDLIVHDALAHASTIDGARSSRAEMVAAPHNDVDAVESAIRRWRMRGGRGTPWIAVESLYSMDGTMAPIQSLMRVVETQDAFLIVDEAHAVGVLGPHGAVLAAAWAGHEQLITLYTAGKALGTSGALIGADRRLIDFLINRARNFIYATAPSPLIAAATRESLRILADQPELRDRVAALVHHAGNRLADCGATRTGTQIIPLILGSNARAVEVARRLQQAGFDCRAIRPPTVPEGTARLRISITLNVDEGIIDQLADTLMS
jgi:8-amino-7-oxononanoate synthase